MFVKELEITLENGMKISGELDLPERQGQWKTIILFHGSGPSDRHATVESMGGIVSRNFDLLSEGFVKARYAVFRYDKRENYDIEIIIRDAREVTRFVSGLSEVEGILFYGWSEGVRVCTTLVSDFPNAQALILQSGIAEGWSSYFSYILRELTVEKLKELDNNSDSILEISDFLNCIPDSTSISFSLYLLILGTDKEGNMKFNEELDPEGKGRFSIIDNWIPLADEIVAFYLGEYIAESEIEDYLKIHLPEYSIPNSINRLENFPLNANGKVDRRRLAEYQKTDSVEIMSDKVLNIVLMIWEELLKNKVADLDENLFKIGADSLLAARFVAAINARCGIEVRMKEVFMNPSINALTKLVDKRKNTDIAEFVEEGEI